MTLNGHCSCGAVRYALDSDPMIVHCCHCSWCQRETGSAFVINAVIETDRVTVDGEIEMVMTPSESGRGQEIARCPNCHVALWSHYPNAGRKAAFIRAGTLEGPLAVSPDVHIYTSTKLDWVTLPEEVPVFAEFYDPGSLWTPEMKVRWAALMAG